MPRKKPTLQLGVYGSFDINPEKAVTSYFESKLQTDLIFKKPCWDVPREGLQHEALENERKFIELSTQQEVFQKKAAIQKKINEKKIDDMHDTQLQLRDKFIKVNDFIKECVEKTVRTETQIEKELKQQKMLNEEIKEISSDLNELLTFEEKFKGVIKELQHYENVFNEVIETSGTYESFEDLMSRSDALMLAQVEIAEREQELIKDIELIRQKILKSTFEASQKIIELNTELARIERTYNNAKAEAMKWEITLSRTKDYIADNEKETITLMDSIQHLYQLLAERNDEKVKLKKYDISGQLDYIHEEIEVLEDIIKRAHHKMAKEGMSLLGEGTNRFLNPDKETNLSN
ncbi:CLUMA_CG009109, isoform A [Clunio marinus]|uniref:CLUMA_CG009109, isoform A n=1 Tax=Clunio marinus TaxID=568069 RepID=A0A1J1I633_9DIPT|nr:CLUMA_CG009109, isoform A [Clunio marinus]